LILTKDAITLNPGSNYQWLVFHSKGLEQPITILITRTIVLEGKYVILLGENPQGVFLKLGVDDVTSVVTVPLIHVEAMGQSVIRV